MNDRVPCWLSSVVQKGEEEAVDAEKGMAVQPHRKMVEAGEDGQWHTHETRVRNGTMEARRGNNDATETSYSLPHRRTLPPWPCLAADQCEGRALAEFFSRKFWRNTEAFPKTFRRLSKPISM